MIVPSRIFDSVNSIDIENPLILGTKVISSDATNSLDDSPIKLTSRVDYAQSGNIVDIQGIGNSFADIKKKKYDEDDEDEVEGKEDL